MCNYIDMRVTIVGEGKLPIRETSESAGYDLFSGENTVILPYSNGSVNLGIVIALESGTYGQIYMRSSLAKKYGLLAMGGVIDSDYRGVVHVLIFNTSASLFEVKKGDKIAQLVVHRIVQKPSVSYSGIPDFVYMNRMRPVCPRDSINVFNNMLQELVERQKYLLINSDLEPSNITQSYVSKVNTAADFFPTKSDTLNYHSPSRKRTGGFGSTDK